MWTGNTNPWWRVTDLHRAVYMRTGILHDVREETGSGRGALSQLHITALEAAACGGRKSQLRLPPPFFQTIYLNINNLKKHYDVGQFSWLSNGLRSVFH